MFPPIFGGIQLTFCAMLYVWLVGGVIPSLLSNRRRVPSTIARYPFIKEGTMNAINLLVKTIIFKYEGGMIVMLIDTGNFGLVRLEMPAYSLVTCIMGTMGIEDEEDD